ncbi:hypothetical protein BDP27DRAFT_1444419 [Rhodocollybia butyracea]|uniref:Uncharacterized protein n=1 Tax=Rhodocollybia butyracea TaxID=206335 RepID=A0A9P5PX33_9AGAR|nr:hypothetical protein BDP27DRAFT_1444419 [Rhodocollybia butyracea]
MRAALLLLIPIASFMLAVCIPVPPVDGEYVAIAPAGPGYTRPPDGEGTNPSPQKKLGRRRSYPPRAVTFIRNKGDPAGIGPPTTFGPGVTSIGFSRGLNDILGSAENHYMGTWEVSGEKWVYFKATGEGCNPSCFGWSATGPERTLGGTGESRYWGVSLGDPARNIFTPKNPFPGGPSNYAKKRREIWNSLVGEFERGPFMNPPASQAPPDRMAIPRIMNTSAPPGSPAPGQGSASGQGPAILPPLRPRPGDH